MQNNPLVGKKIYVPSAARPPARKVEPRAEVPRDLLLEPAGSVFRSVPWNGAVAVAVAPPAAQKPLDPLAPARLVFAGVPWSGDERPAPTVTQSARSVTNVLGLFKWEQ